MFARWDRMAKQFTRVGKGNRDRRWAGGSDPTTQPGAPSLHAERQGRQTCPKTG